MGSFDLALEIARADLKKLRAEKAVNEHNIERVQVIIESLKQGKKLEE